MQETCPFLLPIFINNQLFGYTNSTFCLENDRYETLTVYGITIVIKKSKLISKSAHSGFKSA